jgi:hypothetical protein
VGDFLLVAMAMHVIHPDRVTAASERLHLHLTRVGVGEA